MFCDKHSCKFDDCNTVGVLVLQIVINFSVLDLILNLSSAFLLHLHFILNIHTHFYDFCALSCIVTVGKNHRVMSVIFKLQYFTRTY